MRLGAKPRTNSVRLILINRFEFEKHTPTLNRFLGRITNREETSEVMRFRPTFVFVIEWVSKCRRDTFTYTGISEGLFSNQLKVWNQ